MSNTCLFNAETKWCDFADDIFKLIFLSENCCFFKQLSANLHPGVQSNGFEQPPHNYLIQWRHICINKLVCFQFDSKRCPCAQSEVNNRYENRQRKGWFHIGSAIKWIECSFINGIYSSTFSLNLDNSGWFDNGQFWVGIPEIGFLRRPGSKSGQRKTSCLLAIQNHVNVPVHNLNLTTNMCTDEQPTVFPR